MSSTDLSAYDAFLRAKMAVAAETGFDVRDEDIHPVLKLHQKSIVRWAVHGGRRAIFAAFGLGKCHGPGTPILMHDGTIKPVEDVRSGDQVMGDDGSPRNVLSLASGRGAMYRVVLKNGDTYTCNRSHVFSLRVSNRFGCYKSGSLAAFEVRDYARLPEYARQNCFKHYKVPVDFPSQQVPFDPYLFGAWLGDGDSKTLAWTINDRDQEIVERIREFAASRGLSVRSVPQRGCTYHHVTQGMAGKKRQCDEFYFVRQNGAAGKRIDPVYLRNDRETRLQLLAGLLDTDGHLIAKCYDIVTKWEELRDDILFLCRSLGFSVRHATKVVNGVTYWRIYISGDTHLIPCITRKKAGRREQIKNPLNYGFTVEEIGEGDYYGFEIDGNHLYLLGDFTVTHNSVMQLEAVRLVRERAGGRGLIVAPLGVRQEFTRDARMLGMDPKFVRRIEEAADPDGIYLTNYETIRDGKMSPHHFSVVSLDEADCFPPGTPVETPNGFVPIERVKIGQRIVNASGVDHVQDAFRTEVRRAVRVTCGSRSLVCSPEHLLFTGRGWMAAAELRPGDAIMEAAAAVRLLRGGDHSGYPAGSQEAVLQSVLLCEMASHDAGGTRQRPEGAGRGPEPAKPAAEHQAGREVATVAAVQAMRRDHHAGVPAAGRQAVLQQELLRQVADGSAGDPGEGLQRGSRREAREEDQSLVRLGQSVRRGGQEAHRGFKLVGRPGGAGEAFREVQRPTDPEPPGERRGIDGSAGGSSGSAGDGMGSRVLRLSREAGEGLPDLLQARPRASHSEDQYRSGWAFSSNARSEGGGSEAGCEAGFARVDGVEVLEPGHPDLERYRDADGRIYFYDLTAARHPSFSVSGLLVHNCLRGFGGTKTFREFMALFAGDRKTLNARTQGEAVRYRFVATATPSPNDYIELLAYAAFLGVMDVSGAKTRFFKRDSTKADTLTIHPHKVEEFWLWVATWACVIEKPSDLGPEYSDDGYALPELRVHYHELPPAKMTGKDQERDGQMRLLRDSAVSLPDAAREKRGSLEGRVEKLAEILALEPGERCILWHDLEDERHAIQQAVPGAVSVWGSQDLEEREKRIIGFSEGEFQYLSAKPSIAGAGCNFQRHCHRAAFLGVGYKFRDWIQAVHRIYRFLQDQPCDIHIIHTEAERHILKTLQEKWEKHRELMARMGEIARQYGLGRVSTASALQRSIGVTRQEESGKNWRLVNQDSIIETAGMEANSVHLILTSIPFSSQYEYSPNYSDLGHSDNNEHFWSQMDFLIPDLLRVLQPGRIAAIHVKDRIVPGGLTGLGFQTVYYFHKDCIDRFEKHGFKSLGMRTIVTDVVRENNQTYRLGWSEQCKDGSRMGCGMPEYLLLFRKPPTEATSGYADMPIEKLKPDCILHTRDENGELVEEIVPHRKGLKIKPGNGYSRTRWQIDAHGYWRSNGNRPLSPEDLEGAPHEAIFKLFREYSLNQVYDYEQHVRLGESLEAKGALPVTFMLLQPQSWHPDVWTDITRMRTLNAAQYAAGREQHLCPLAFDLADRVIVQMSQPGEVVYDPFSGLGTVPLRAVELGRYGLGCELSAAYWMDALWWLRRAEEAQKQLTLFDLLDAEAEVGEVEAVA